MQIAGNGTYDFSDAKISYYTSGIGSSGILTGCLKFTTYGIGSAAVPWGSEVKITGMSDIPEFYVSSRNVDGQTIKWTCYDKLSRSDKIVEFSENDFIKGDPNDTEKKLISSDTALKLCAHTCDLNGYSMAGESMTGLNIIGNIPRSLVEGKTAREILSIFAAALCGHWIVLNNILTFSPLGTAAYGSSISEYEKISDGEQKIFRKIILYNGDNVYTAGDGNARETLIISSPLASSELCGYILTSLREFTYRAWKCKKGLTNYFFYPGDIACADNAVRRCTNVTFTISPAGLLFSAEGNAVNENEYDYENQVQRQLKNKLEFDTPVKNIQVGKTDGLVFIGKNNAAAIKTIAAENGDKIEKYGFDVQSDGVTTYDGAMLDSVFPDIEINEALTEFTASYGDNIKKYTLTWDGNNKVTVKPKEETS